MPSKTEVDNQQQLSDWAVDLRASNDTKNKLSEKFNNFFLSKKINISTQFDELTDQESERLREIFLGAMASTTLTFPQAALDAWHQNILLRRKAVAHSFTDSPSSLYQRYQNTGRISPRVWGTDTDVRDVLADKIVSPVNITKKGVYILPPVDFSNSKNYIHHLTTIANKNIKGAVTTLTPVCSQGHWRLAKASINNGVITQASLWDSMSRQGNAKEIMQKAVDRVTVDGVAVTYIAANIQKDGWSCMDRVVQQALIESDVNDDPIVEAGYDAQKLRAAVQDEILQNKGKPAPNKARPEDKPVFQANTPSSLDRIKASTTRKWVAPKASDQKDDRGPVLDKDTFLEETIEVASKINIEKSKPLLSRRDEVGHLSYAHLSFWQNTVAQHKNHDDPNKGQIEADHELAKRLQAEELQTYNSKS